MADSQPSEVPGNTLTSQGIRPSTLFLWTGAAAGLATGLAELLILGFREFFLGHWFAVSHHVVWLAPLAYLAICLSFAVVFLVVGRLGRWKVDRLWLATLALLVTGSLGLSLPWIAEWAILVCALGVAVQVWRASSTGPDLVRAARGLTIVLSVITGLAGVGTHLGHQIAENRRMAALPEAGQGVPNVLLRLRVAHHPVS